MSVCLELSTDGTIIRDGEIVGPINHAYKSMLIKETNYVSALFVAANYSQQLSIHVCKHLLHY